MKHHSAYPEPLIIRADGLVLDGNVRAYILVQRGVDACQLPYVRYERPPANVTATDVLDLATAAIQARSLTWRIKFLAGLSHSLTIEGRGIYHDHPDGVPKELVVFLVESHHHIASIQAGGWADAERVSGCVRTVLDRATTPRAHAGACWAILRALHSCRVALPDELRQYVGQTCDPATESR